MISNLKQSFCRFCGKTIDQDTIFCNHCGHRLTEENTRITSNFQELKSDLVIKSKSSSRKKTYISTIIWVLISLAVIIGISFSLGGENKYTAVNAQLDKLCPIDLCGMGEIYHIAIENDNLVYYAQFRDNYVEMQYLEQNKHIIEDIIFYGFFLLNGQQANAAERLIDWYSQEGLGLKFKVKNDRGDNFVHTLTIDQLEKGFEFFNRMSPTEAVAKLLEANIELYNSSLPQQIDNGLWMSSLTTIGDTLIVNIIADKQYYNVKEMCFENITIYDLFEPEKNLDPDTRRFLAFSKMGNVNLVWRYSDKDSHEYRQLFISKDDIKKIKTNSIADNF